MNSVSHFSSAAELRMLLQTARALHSETCVYRYFRDPLDFCSPFVIIDRLEGPMLLTSLALSLAVRINERAA